MTRTEHPGYVRIGTGLIRLDGARARLERSFQTHLRLYAGELRAADPADADTFIALIQCAPDLRLPAGRVADLCGVPTAAVKAWARGRDLPDPQAREEALRRLLAEVEGRVRVAPVLDPQDQAASRNDGS